MKRRMARKWPMQPSSACLDSLLQVRGRVIPNEELEHDFATNNEPGVGPCRGYAWSTRPGIRTHRRPGSCGEDCRAGWRWQLAGTGLFNEVDDRACVGDLHKARQAEGAADQVLSQSLEARHIPRGEIRAAIATEPGTGQARISLTRAWSILPSPNSRANTFCCQSLRIGPASSGGSCTKAPSGRNPPSETMAWIWGWN